MLTGISFDLINSVKYQLCQSQKRQYHLCGDELCARPLLCTALMRNETLQSAPHDIRIAKPKNWLQFCSWMLVYCCDKVYRLLSNYCNHNGIPVFLFEKNSDSYAAMKE